MSDNLMDRMIPSGVGALEIWVRGDKALGRLGGRWENEPLGANERHKLLQTAARHGPTKRGIALLKDRLRQDACRSPGVLPFRERRARSHVGGLITGTCGSLSCVARVTDVELTSQPTGRFVWIA